MKSKPIGGNIIKYKGGYKYQLKRDYEVQTGVYPLRNCYSKFIRLTRHGKLYISAGYAWDGPSGPTFDTENFMRGSLVHDALYQLIREGWLDPSYREQADKELHRLCREDGMCRIRAWWVYWAVRWFGEYGLA